jgi:hypothetical protein
MSNENDIVPSNIMQFFIENPKISRRKLKERANISENEARFYCKLMRKKQEDIKIKSVGIAVWDLHYPYQYKEGFTCILKICCDLSPNIFILGGDQMDFDMISSYNRKKPKLLEGKRIGTMYDHFQKEIIDQLELVLSNDCKKHFFIGNHEFRVERLLEYEPKLEGLVEIGENLKLDKWNIIEYNKILQLGHMHFMHGIYWDKYHSEKHSRIYQKNIFYGHVHNSQIFTMVSPIDSLPKQAVSIGCMCNTNPEYRENQPNSWINQFMLFYILTDGTFRYEIITILNGCCIVNGKLYDGNKKTPTI